MNKKGLTMLILSCVFVTIAVLLTALDAYVSISSYMLLFGSHPENFGEALGAALGGVFLYIYTILLGIAILAFGFLTRYCVYGGGDYLCGHVTCYLSSPRSGEVFKQCSRIR